MTPRIRAMFAGIVLGATLAPQAARGEGAAEVGDQVLARETIAYVDIIDATVETFTFTGSGTILVNDPTGVELGTFRSGDLIRPVTTRDGPYEIIFYGDQDPGWDFTVNDPVSDGGRLHSYHWYFDALVYGAEGAWDGSLFVLVPAGGDGYDGVVEVQSEGWAGYQWEVLANRHGVDGAESGRSTLTATNLVTPEYPVYLNNPARATYRIKEPHASDLVFQAGTESCDAVSPGHLPGSFVFETDVTGTYHLGCDLNGDGYFDVSTNDDLMITGVADPGTNEVPWDGTDNVGQPLSAGVYNCKVTVAVGELHFIAADIETSYPGLRLYRMSETDARTPLVMYWNDEAVQQYEVDMPNGEPGVESSGKDGMYSDAYGLPAEPNINARAWGDFSETSKGDRSFLDTFSWLDRGASDSFTVRVLAPETDADGNGVPDIDEQCSGAVPPADGYYAGGCATGSGAPGALVLLGIALGARRRRPGR